MKHKLCKLWHVASRLIFFLFSLVMNGFSVVVIFRTETAIMLRFKD